MFRCPHCGAEHEGAVPPSLLADTLHLSGQKRIILAELTRAGVGVPVDYDDILAAMYSGVRYGGALYARQVMHVATYQLRKLLAPLGYTINGSGGRFRQGVAVLARTYPA